MQKIVLDGDMSAMRGALLQKISSPEYQVTADVGAMSQPELYQFVSHRMWMTNEAIRLALLETGLSQRKFCAEIGCELTGFWRALRSSETNAKVIRGLPMPAVESMCNELDINMSLLCLGLKMQIQLPKRYVYALDVIGSLSEQRQYELLARLTALSHDYLTSPNTMTAVDPTTMTQDDFRRFIGNRCRMYTDEQNLPPAYVIGMRVRRTRTNLFDALTANPPIYIGYPFTLYAVCYCSNIAPEYFMIRNLSQDRILKDIAYFADTEPTVCRQETLRLLCSTELNRELHNDMIAEIISA